MRVSWEHSSFSATNDHVGIHWLLRISSRVSCAFINQIHYQSQTKSVSVFTALSVSVCAGFNYTHAAWIQLDLNHFHRLSVLVLLPHAPPDLSTALEHVVLLSKNARGAVLMKGDRKRVIWLSVTGSVSDATACRKHWRSGRPDTVVWSVLTGETLTRPKLHMIHNMFNRPQHMTR